MRNNNYTTDKGLWIKNSIQIFVVIIVCLFLVMAGSMTLANERVHNNEPESFETLSNTVSENSEFGESESININDSENTSDANSEVNSESINEEPIDSNTDTSPRNSTDESSSNVSIEIYNDPQSNNSSSNKEANENTSVIVNGESIEIPQSGRHRETIKTEDTTTRIRTNIEGDGSSSINIRTESN
jgi:hypothetical protein